MYICRGVWGDGVGCYSHINTTAHGYQKRMSDLLKLELSEVVTHPVWMWGPKLSSSA